MRACHQACLHQAILSVVRSQEIIRQLWSAEFHSAASSRSRNVVCGSVFQPPTHSLTTLSSVACDLIRLPWSTGVCSWNSASSAAIANTSPNDSSSSSQSERVYLFSGVSRVYSGPWRVRRPNFLEDFQGAWPDRSASRAFPDQVPWRPWLNTWRLGRIYCSEGPDSVPPAGRSLNRGRYIHRERIRRRQMIVDRSHS
jgi:hypothetical protein